MNTLAKQYKKQIGSNAIDVDNLDTTAIQKNQDYENETTWWIFEDGSALGLQSDSTVKIKNNYGLHCDHEQLR